MFTIGFWVFHLQTIICQVDVFVMQVSSVVLDARCPDVSDVTEEEVLIAQCNGPDADIELSALVEKWPLEILLDHPV